VVPVPVSHNLIPEQRPLVPRWGWVVIWVAVGVAIAASLLNLRGAKNQVTAEVSQFPQESVVQGSNPLQALPVQSSADNTQTVAAQLPVTFRFSENSWIEVKDAQGQQVIYENVLAGDARSINATPPLQVTLGSVSAVTVEVNAKSVVIPAERVKQNVAHFVLNAAGLIE
jgi:cytoskeleton protein RodZ